MHPALRHYYYYSSSSEALPPDYSSLSSLELYVDYTGLAVGTTNDYGVVDGSGNVTTLKSLAPGPTGRDFTSNGTAPTLGADGIVFGGAGDLINTTKATWNFLHYNAGGAASIKHTIRIVAKAGNAVSPNAGYALLGNTGGASTSKGLYISYDDRLASNLKDALVHSIVRGTSANFISHVQWNNGGIANRYALYTFVTDISQSGVAKVKFYVNNVFVGVYTNLVNNTSPVTTSTYDLQIGAGGNNLLRLTGGVKEVILQSAVDSEAVRSAFDAALIAKHDIVTTSGGFGDDTVFNLYKTLSETRYYLDSIMRPNPTNTSTVVSVFTDGDDHVFDVDRVVSMMKSTDSGVTFGAKSTVYNPADALYGVGSLAGGYGDDGRLHIFATIHTSFSVGGTHKLTYLYSDNDGTSWTTVDLTSVIPSDALNTLRVIGNLIENDGALMVSFYKQTDEGDVTESANYCLRSTDNGANWTVTTMRAKAATYINEGTIIALSDTHLLSIIRNEVTVEYNQFISTDNGLTWTNQGNQAFGEAFTRESPAKLTRFDIAGNRVIACYYADRDNDRLKVIYGTAANLIANGLTGWDTDTKTILKQVETGDYHLHYGDVFQVNNTFAAKAMYPYDQYPITGTGTVNEMWWFDLPTWHYDSVKSQLGL